MDLLPEDPGTFVTLLAFEFLAITTTARAAGTAAAEKIFFGGNFKLLKVEY